MHLRVLETIDKLKITAIYDYSPVTPTDVYI